MKSNVVALSVLASALSISLPIVSFAETCYVADGVVNTKNITSTLQVGNIDLALLDAAGGEVFNEMGALIGTVTGADGFGTTLLSHKANFSRGSTFVTKGDKAQLAFPYVRATLEDGVTPCSYWIHEEISSIEKGTGFFNTVSSVSVSADGYISFCPNENGNHFEITGNICVE